jgi:drug/metabolite transporter (DMT)-like permease
VGLGWAVLGEHLTVQMLGGFALVVASATAVWRLEHSKDRRKSRGGALGPT